MSKKSYTRGLLADQKRRHGNPWRRWYDTKRWRRIRLHQLAKQPLCERCTQLGYIVAATVVDHVVPHRGAEDLFWNGGLQSLCKGHHDGEKQSEERRGYSTEIGPEGWPVDERHPANDRSVRPALVSE